MEDGHAVMSTLSTSNRDLSDLFPFHVLNKVKNKVTQFWDFTCSQIRESNSILALNYFVFLLSASV